MKKINFKKYIIGLILVFTVSISFADSTPGDPGEDPSGGGEPIGGGAPIGGGLFILMSLGAAYGTKKVYNLYCEKKESLEE